MTTGPLRLFVALTVPSSTCEKLSGLVETLKQDNLPIKWVAKENLHWTLQFLGWTESKQVEKISAALSQATEECKPFLLSLKQLDFFPSNRPRVILINPNQGAAEAIALQAKIRQTLVTEGISLEAEKPPHLTLGRVKKPTVISKDGWKRKTKEVIEGIEPTEVKEVVLFQSELRGEGPTYTKLKVFPLGKVPSTQPR
ncbi:MAG: RNA 2',3'-cyclic phosphodiesterase [bacterium]|nr:RNA 2',3'-cyclic phosphodiesterase [bacterium]